MKVNKNATKKTENNYIKVTQADVVHVRAVEFNGRVQVFFTLILNGVSINDCRVVEGKDGDFIGFPARKGNDGKYYNHAYANISPEDSESILDRVEKEVNS